MSGHGYNQVVEVVGKADEKDPNSIDVERSAISVASADVNTNTTLLDVAAMSSSIRERVYLMAQSKASERINVIVTFIRRESSGVEADDNCRLFLHRSGPRVGLR